MKTSSLVVVWFALMLSAACFVPSAEAQAEEDAAPRKVVTRIMPAYPQMARNINLSGAVKLEALVSADGSVKSIKARGGNPLLSQSAESAVRDWKWEKWEKSDHEITELVEVRFYSVRPQRNQRASDTSAACDTTFCAPGD